MSPAVLRLVLLVSCAHAMVHVYEQALPSVEQSIAADYGVGPETTGPLGTVWRVPFGAGALLAGWLADRYGSKRMLLMYLAGCVLTSLLAWQSPSLGVLFAAMFAMGSFGSIYHPAGLALISHQTTPSTRGRALGWHGIFGSVGIAGAPFLASAVFRMDGVTWRDYYLLLTVPGLLLAVGIAGWLPVQERCGPKSAVAGTAGLEPSDDPRWGAFFALVAVGTMAGFIYAAFTHFLTRYLDSAGVRPTDTSPESFRTMLAGVVLICGAFGQGIAGRLAQPARLSALLAVILLAQGPCLAWMALAEGRARLWATCLLAFVHFMQQPVYNSLIARYVPRRRLSLGFGFSNMMCFGVGAVGPAFAGYLRYVAGPGQGDLWTYGSLAGLALLAGLAALTIGPTSRRGATPSPGARGSF